MRFNIMTCFGKSLKTKLLLEHIITIMFLLVSIDESSKIISSHIQISPIPRKSLSIFHHSIYFRIYRRKTIQNLIVFHLFRTMASYDK